MSRDQSHPHAPDDSFDGGDLDCGNGLLLLIRKHIDPLASGQLLEILSLESSVEEDLPAWCRLTGNQLVNVLRRGGQRSFLVSKGAFVPPPAVTPPAPAIVVGADGRRQAPITQPVVAPTIPVLLPAPAPAPAIAPLSVMGVGSCLTTAVSASGSSTRRASASTRWRRSWPGPDTPSTCSAPSACC